MAGEWVANPPQYLRPLVSALCAVATRIGNGLAHQMPTFFLTSRALLQVQPTAKGT